MSQPKYIKNLLDKLSDGNNIPEKVEMISLEEFIAGIIKWKEQTTTSPSGRHFGLLQVINTPTNI
jgi:hypothetical protein